MDRISLKLPIKAIPKGRPRFSRRGHVFTPPRTKLFEATLAGMMKAGYLGKPLQGELIVFVSFCFKRPGKPANRYPPTDVDNLIKSTLDAANGILWDDDAQVSFISAHKSYGPIDQIVLNVGHVAI